MYDDYGPDFPEETVVRDLRNTPGTRLYVDEEGEAQIRKSLSHLDESRIHLIDIGDYHYITRLYLYNVNETFDLLVFDHHSDDQEPLIKGLRSCGSWIRDAMEDMPETLMSVKLIRSAGDKTYLKGGFNNRRPLYISIDKDVLSPDICPSNWDQGDMETDTMEDLIRSETEGRRVIGADICGGPVLHDGNMGQYYEEIMKNKETDRILISLFNSLL